MVIFALSLFIDESSFTALEAPQSSDGIGLCFTFSGVCILAVRNKRDCAAADYRRVVPFN
jgi:hypothetical protein